MTIGEGFRDDIGFVRRTGVTRQFYDAAWMPQPEVASPSRHSSIAAARARLELLRSARRPGHATGTHRQAVTWENGSYFEYAFEPRVEAITTPFTISPGVVIPPGRYDWNQHLAVVRKRSQQAALRIDSRDVRRFLERHAEDDADERALPAELPAGVRPGPAGERHRPDAPRRRRSRRRWRPFAPATRSAPTCSSTRCCSIATTSTSSPRTSAST